MSLLRDTDPPPWRWLRTESQLEHGLGFAGLDRSKGAGLPLAASRMAVDSDEVPTPSPASLDLLTATGKAARKLRLIEPCGSAREPRGCRPAARITRQRGPLQVDGALNRVIQRLGPGIGLGWFAR